MGALVLGVFAQERGEEGGQPNAFLFFPFVAVKMVLIAIVISEFVVIPAPYSFLPISYL